MWNYYLWTDFPDTACGQNKRTPYTRRRSFEPDLVKNVGGLGFLHGVVRSRVKRRHYYINHRIAPEAIFDI